MLGHLLPFVEGVTNLQASLLSDFSPEHGFIRRLASLIIAPEASCGYAKGFAPPWGCGKIVRHGPDIAKSLIRISQGNGHRPLNARVVVQLLIDCIENIRRRHIQAKDRPQYELSWTTFGANNQAVIGRPGNKASTDTTRQEKGGHDQADA